MSSLQPNLRFFLIIPNYLRSQVKSYNKFVIIDIKFRFTCGESDLSKQYIVPNIMTRKVAFSPYRYNFPLSSSTESFWSLHLTFFFVYLLLSPWHENIPWTWNFSFEYCICFGCMVFNLLSHVCFLLSTSAAQKIFLFRFV